mmetsp:Transcript_18623/g.28097  ORF Transcript_18623/g.28097 Transcript_18623/m.28097 type:complete len:126 (+) Transcript_18623:144-521(+)|eukprot:scaffold33698_cov153-Skeletonema_dohrnii-CCMP3373.AAC.5
MKSANKTTNEKGILPKLSIPPNPAQHKLQLHNPQYNGNCNKKLHTLLLRGNLSAESASAKKVRNEQFCKHRSIRSPSTSNQAGLKLPIEIRESLNHAIRCDQKSMQVERRWMRFVFQCASSAKTS